MTEQQVYRGKPKDKSNIYIAQMRRKHYPVSNTINILLVLIILNLLPVLDILSLLRHLQH